MSRSDLENESLYGILIEKDGEAVIEVRHRDGSIDHIPIHNSERIPINFKKSEEVSPDFLKCGESRPSSWDPNADTEILIRRSDVPLCLPINEHIRRSCELEALLHKIFSNPKYDESEVLDCGGNEFAKSIIYDLQRIVGGSWSCKHLK